MDNLRSQLAALVSKYKGGALCASEYSSMLRKARILGAAIGMPSGELLDMMIESA